jgi:hypothetical protein
MNQTSAPNLYNPLLEPNFNVFTASTPLPDDHIDITDFKSLEPLTHRTHVPVEATRFEMISDFNEQSNYIARGTNVNDQNIFRLIQPIDTLSHRVGEVYSSEQILKPKRQLFFRCRANENRRRINKKPPGAHNPYGRSGTLRCRACRSRKSKVNEYD